MTSSHLISPSPFGVYPSVCVYTVITNGFVLLRMYDSYEAGGPSMCCVRWSNEAATVHADITADHRDVPAHD